MIYKINRHFDFFIGKSIIEETEKKNWLKKMKKFNFFEKILHKVIYFYSYPKYLFIKTEEFFIKKALIRKENSNFLFNFIKDNTNYLPSSNIQISSLIASRARKIVDKNGNNRIKPHRWIMINNKIKK